MRKQRGYWTKEHCHEESLKYNSKTDFCKKSNTAYKSAMKNGWLHEICSHMNTVGNRYNRCIYVYEFTDNYVYVGLTYNITKRHINRLNSITDAVTIHIKETNLQPILKQLTDYIDVEEAVELENYYVNFYKENGWHILNKAKTGAIGGNNIKWTYDKCKKEALKYTTRNEYLTYSTSSYQSAKRNGWLDDLCNHMLIINRPNGYWTKEKCIEEALKYKNRSDFRKNSTYAYKISSSNDWLDDICSHMIEKQKPGGYWTKERCVEEALKYDSRTDFCNSCSGAYNSARKNNWINDICSHMIEQNKPNGYWTKERCVEEALKYDSRTDFCKKSNGAYSVSLKNDWLDEICSHIKHIDNKPNGYWNIYINCKNEAKKYRNRSEFHNKSHAAYQASIRNSWIDLFLPKK